MVNNNSNPYQAPYENVELPYIEKSGRLKNLEETLRKSKAKLIYGSPIGLMGLATAILGTYMVSLRNSYENSPSDDFIWTTLSYFVMAVGVSNCVIFTDYVKEVIDDKKSIEEKIKKQELENYLSQSDFTPDILEKKY